MDAAEEDLSQYCQDCLKRNRKVLADRNGLCRLCNQNKSDNDLASPHPEFNRKDEEPPLPRMAGSFEPTEERWPNIQRPGPPDFGPRRWTPTAPPPRSEPKPAQKPAEPRESQPVQRLPIRPEQRPQPAPTPKPVPIPAQEPERKHRPVDELRQVLSFEAVEATLAELLRQMDEGVEVLAKPQVRNFVQKLGEQKRERLEELRTKIALRALEIQTLK